MFFIKIHPLLGSHVKRFEGDPEPSEAKEKLSRPTFQHISQTYHNRCKHQYWMNSSLLSNLMDIYYIY